MNTTLFFILQNAPKVTTVKDVLINAVTTVLETELSAIMSLVLVTWAVIQGIKEIYVHFFELSMDILFVY